MTETLIAVMVVFAISLIMTEGMRRFALKKNIMDIPGERSSHTVATPRGGGVAIVVAFYTGIIILLWNGESSGNLGLLFAAIPVALVGVMDDRSHVHAGIRLLVHLASSVLLLYLLFDNNSVLQDEITVSMLMMAAGMLVSVVWLVNLYNFMDGIDGIASVEAICVALGILLIVMYQKLAGNFPDTVPAGDINMIIALLMVLIAAVAGFLVWNWPPARIFMGDAGSGFLGMMLAIIALLASIRQVTGIWPWLILLSVFLVDATFTLVRRIIRKDKWYSAHCSHAYQHAAKYLGSHASVDWIIALYSITWLFPLAFLSELLPEFALGWLALACLPTLVAVYGFGAGLPGPGEQKTGTT